MLNRDRLVAFSKSTQGPVPTVGQTSMKDWEGWIWAKVTTTACLGLFTAAALTPPQTPLCHNAAATTYVADQVALLSWEGEG